LIDSGEIIRDYCLMSLQSVVYDTPESYSYKRTFYLYNSLYIVTDNYTDFHEVAARASAFPRRVYYKEEDLQKYQMSFVPMAEARQVRVVAGAIYALDVEVGNNPRGPRPFMRQGLEQSKHEVENNIRARTSEQLSRIRNKHYTVEIST
jgi:hypothetical protein